MKRVQISYYDHYDALEPLLPRTGTLSENKSIGGRDGWHVVTLDAPFTLPDSNPARLASHFGSSLFSVV